MQNLYLPGVHNIYALSSGVWVSLIKWFVIYWEGMSEWYVDIDGQYVCQSDSSMFAFQLLKNCRIELDCGAIFR